MKKAEPLVTTKVSMKTLRLVRRIARKTNDKQYQIIERAVEAEYNKPSEKDA